MNLEAGTLHGSCVSHLQVMTQGAEQSGDMFC